VTSEQMENTLISRYVPFVISFNIEGLAYNEGFKKPIGPFPALSRSSLMRLITAPKMGVLAEVPPSMPYSPPL
jgi:hypothetical protein